jgi:hypothetical protein
MSEMKAFTDPDELVEEVDEAKAHIINRAIFWKRRWSEFSPPAQIVWNWTSVPFDTNSTSQVPNDKHGLYTFILSPRVASHPKNFFVLYVGKADKTTLQERFKHYFQEKKKVKRPHICHALNKFDGHIEFCFTTVTRAQDIEPGEDALLVALMPPYNERFPASVAQIITGLR